MKRASISRLIRRSSYKKGKRKGFGSTLRIRSKGLPQDSSNPSRRRRRRRKRKKDEDALTSTRSFGGPPTREEPRQQT